MNFVNTLYILFRFVIDRFVIRSRPPLLVEQKLFKRYGEYTIWNQLCQDNKRKYKNIIYLIRY